MYPAKQDQGLTCRACQKAVSTQSIQKCKDCNKGYCAQCFKKRNELESTADKTEQKCIPCENTILIVQLEMEDKTSFPQSHGAQGQFSHGTSLVGRSISVQIGQSQSTIKHGGGSVTYQKDVTSMYPKGWDAEEIDSENEDGYDDYGYSPEFSAEQTSRKKQSASKKKDRDCPIYLDKNGKRVPFALILAGVVVDYDRVPPLTGNKEYSTGLKGSQKYSSNFSAPKNKNAGMKKNGQQTGEKGNKNQNVPHPNNQYQRLKGSSDVDFSGQSNEILEVKKANTPSTAVSFTDNDTVNKPLTQGTDEQRADIQQRDISRKAHSINVKDFWDNDSSLIDKKTIGSLESPPVAMMLAGYAGPEYLQKALLSRMMFVDSGTQQFSRTSRLQDYMNGRDDAVLSRQKSMKNKNLMLTKTSVKELTDNNGKNSTKREVSNTTTMSTAVEDTKQSFSYSTSTDGKKESLESQGKSAKEPFRRPQLEEHSKDQKRAHIGRLGDNNILNLGNDKSMKETYERDEKMKTPKGDSENTEIRGLESNHILVEKSTETVIEDIKQDNPKKDKSLDYDNAKEVCMESATKDSENSSGNKGTSMVRSIETVPVDVPESSMFSPRNETSEEPDSDDDDDIPYALRMAGISREPHRKNGKVKAESDKPFALQHAEKYETYSHGRYRSINLYGEKQNDKKDGQSDSDVQSGYLKFSFVHYVLGSKHSEIDTEENDQKSLEGSKHDTSVKTGIQNVMKITKKNKVTSKAISFTAKIVPKMDETPTHFVEDCGIMEVEKVQNSDVESKKENPMDEGSEKKEKRTDIIGKPLNNNTENGSMEVIVLNPTNKKLSETESEPVGRVDTASQSSKMDQKFESSFDGTGKKKKTSDDSLAAGTQVDFDASITEGKHDKEADLPQGVDKSVNVVVSDSKNNPQEQILTITTMEENNSVNEKRTETSLAHTINDKLKTPCPDVQFEASSAIGVSDEAMPSVVDNEDVEQTSKTAKMETSIQDIQVKNEEVDHSKSQFQVKSEAPLHPSIKTCLMQSSGEKVKDGHSNQNVTRQEGSQNISRQEVKPSEPNSGTSKERKTDELCDSPDACDIDHSEIHHAFLNIGRKRAHRSTLCCIGCGRPECQSKVMQNMVLMHQAAQKNGLKFYDVDPDGNCMFTALVDQLVFEGDHSLDAWKLRQNAVEWLKNNPCSKDGTHYSSFLDSESWEEYLLRLSQDTQWGDHIILRATAEFLKRNIEILTPKETLEFHKTKIEPEFSRSGQDEKSLLLGHVGESHYVSLRPEDLQQHESITEEEETEKKITKVEKWKDEEGENPYHMSPDCREKVQMFEEAYIDSWSGCPGIHLTFALRKTLPPAIICQEANSISNEILSYDNEVQESWSFHHGDKVIQVPVIKTLVGTVIEGLYCQDLDTSTEPELFHDWAEMTAIFVRQDIKVIEASQASNNAQNLHMEEGTVHPGFVRLIYANSTVNQQYGTSNQGIKYVNNSSFKIQNQLVTKIKYKMIKTRSVYGIPCSYWPKTAERWASRKRFEGWPSENIIHDIVNEGCLILPVSHKKSQNPDMEFQISFALAEKKLSLQAVSNEQRYCYIIWKAICNQVCNGRNLMGAIFYKTVFFFACETIPAEYWRSHSGPCILFMFDELLNYIRGRNMPNYFVPANNLLDTFDAEKLKTVEELLGNLRMDILQYVRLLLETTKRPGISKRPTEILEKVIDDIQKFRHHQSARISTLELFVPLSINMATESIQRENYKEGFDRLNQAYEERLSVCTCDDQMPINLFIHGALSEVDIFKTTWFLLYCDERLQGQLTTSLMQEIGTYHEYTLIRIGDILPAEIFDKYADVQVPEYITSNLCNFSCRFAIFLNHIGNSSLALQILYFCIRTHKEWEQKTFQSSSTGDQQQDINSMEHHPDIVADFSDYNIMDVYDTLKTMSSAKSEIKLLQQVISDFVQVVNRVSSSSAFYKLSSFFTALGENEASQMAFKTYQELRQKEDVLQKQTEAAKQESEMSSHL
ncbi:hypothetical protein CHS0354_036603 [Potamilus streckersoni]|uniref:OTU domain-containing protein n=1 Tax=Potamilus streckersoni TaxID=2493646 RepID=A0AAE0TG58_9BIVA|nr:hypothetical protein CHS0354_036603 [Potamilus streckersoni]